MMKKVEKNNLTIMDTQCYQRNIVCKKSMIYENTIIFDDERNATKLFDRISLSFMIINATASSTK